MEGVFVGKKVGVFVGNFVGYIIGIFVGTKLGIQLCVSVWMILGRKLVL